MNIMFHFMKLLFLTLAASIEFSMNQVSYLTSYNVMIEKRSSSTLIWYIDKFKVL